MYFYFLSSSPGGVATCVPCHNPEETGRLLQTIGILVGRNTLALFIGVLPTVKIICFRAANATLLNMSEMSMDQSVLLNQLSKYLLGLFIKTSAFHEFSFELAHSILRFHFSNFNKLMKDIQNSIHNSSSYFRLSDLTLQLCPHRGWGKNENSLALVNY